MAAPHAIVSPEAELGAGVEIGPFSVVHANVVLGDGAVIGSHCVVGHPAPGASGPLRLGPGATIRSHTVLYEGSEFGPGLETGHHVTLREGIRAGVDLRVGTQGDVQGDARFGDYVRLHSNVFVSKRTAIEDFAWIFPGVTFTEDPHPPSDGCNAGAAVGRYAVVAAAATLLPGVTIGDDAVVAAGSLVTHSVEPGVLVAGIPARPRGPASGVRLRDGSQRPAYPWRSHFARGYPPEVIDAWRAER
jgi:acetyltransferase-like isoleucine patch superfamily enzyme